MLGLVVVILIIFWITSSNKQSELESKIDELRDEMGDED